MILPNERDKLDVMYPRYRIIIPDKVHSFVPASPPVSDSIHLLAPRSVRS